MCDLLEVYSPSEKETLKRTHGIYMKESELARSIAQTTGNEETLQFVDMDTLRYQKIASQKVETIRLNAEQRKTNNNLIDQAALYSDIESDDEDDDEDDNNKEKSDNNNDDGDRDGDDKNKNSSSESEEESEEEEEQPQKQNNWNKNKRLYKEEIDVDDI